MEKMWAGRFQKQLNESANDFNSSIRIDARMYQQDILGSVAHAEMLGRQGIITTAEAEKITAALTGILEEIQTGKLKVDMQSEDIHMFVEAELTKRIGDTGKRLHTARSRNDQVALDIRLYMRDATAEIIDLLYEIIAVITKKAEAFSDAIMPGYTHLQRAQPITFGHHCMAYACMFQRDIGRINDAVKRMNYSPLGSAALAGTTHPIDRAYTAQRLSFTAPVTNSLDGVSDRDFLIEIASAFAVVMMHLSRFCEEIILWSSFEFKFVELDDAYSTGSSIMPQKKNPDMAELIRGKSGRVYGDLMALLTQMKGIPLAYNKDMQEDKEAIFDSLDTVKQCLSIFIPMFDTMQILRENMRRAAAGGFINATDCADYLVKKGMPFRSAYKIVGQLVAYCIEKNKDLERLTLDEYRAWSDVFEEDVYAAISLENCVAARVSYGGTGNMSVLQQIKDMKEFLRGNKNAQN
ncbi:MAG: argininosuccinate lyase [Clostridia bacterium]|nr:argininosuccinate lyase [Clostridia bacterium]